MSITTKTTTAIITILISMILLPSCGKEKKEQRPKTVQVTKLPSVSDGDGLFPYTVLSISPKGVVRLRAAKIGGYAPVGEKVSTRIRYAQDGAWHERLDSTPIVADGPISVGDKVALWRDYEEHLLETGEAVKYLVGVRAKRLENEKTE